MSCQGSQGIQDKDIQAATILCFMSQRACVYGVPMYLASNSTKCGNVCACCNTTVSPLWRKGWPVQTRSGYIKETNVCNKCGLHLAKVVVRE